MEILLIIIMCSSIGCTWTFHRSPMKLHIPQTPLPRLETPYQYYVIDENSTVPDAYFETKMEAENYKEYFKENHNYKIISMK